MLTKVKLKKCIINKKKRSENIKGKCIPQKITKVRFLQIVIIISAANPEKLTHILLNSRGYLVEKHSNVMFQKRCEKLSKLLIVKI
jgi:hypothetical protein